MLNAANLAKADDTRVAQQLWAQRLEEKKREEEEIQKKLKQKNKKAKEKYNNDLGIGTGKTLQELYSHMYSANIETPTEQLVKQVNDR